MRLSDWGRDRGYWGKLNLKWGCLIEVEIEDIEVNLILSEAVWLRYWGRNRWYWDKLNLKGGCLIEVEIEDIEVSLILSEAVWLR